MLMTDTVWWPNPQPPGGNSTFSYGVHVQLQADGWNGAFLITAFDITTPPYGSDHGVPSSVGLSNVQTASINDSVLEVFSVANDAMSPVS